MTPAAYLATTIWTLLYTQAWWCIRRCVPRLRCLVVLPTRDLAAQVFKVSPLGPCPSHDR